MGILPLLKNLLRIFKQEGAKISAEYFQIAKGIPSKPMALFGGSLFNESITSFNVKGVESMNLFKGIQCR